MSTMFFFRGGGKGGCLWGQMCSHIYNRQGARGNESVPKITVNDNNFFFFLKRSQHFGNFKPYQCCLIKLLPYVLFEKNT